MNENQLKMKMKLFTETTKISTILLSSINIYRPICLKGIENKILNEFVEFEELIDYIDDLFSKLPTLQYRLNQSYCTYKTKSQFTYNIIFFMERDKTAFALVGGPVLTVIPTKQQINIMTINSNLITHRKNEFLSLIYSLPVYSEKYIQITGKLLFTLMKPWKKNTDLEQIIVGNIIHTDLYEIEFLKFQTNNSDKLYRLCALICKYISHGDVDGVMDAISENMEILFSLRNKSDHYHSLKCFCSILSTVSCVFAFKSDVSLDTIYNKLWNFVMGLDHLNSANDIIQQMTLTIKEFARATNRYTNNNYSLHINKILEYIHKHFREKITLHDLSEYVHLSSEYISYQIKKETNLSLSDHINLIRIRESKNLLLFTDKLIKDISFDVGYNHQSHFNTIFKKYEGITPCEFRDISMNKNYAQGKVCI